MGKNTSEGNLNETHRESTDKRERKRDSSGFNRYFVNLGLIDGMTKVDLINFLSDVASIDRKFFGEFSLQKNCGYFDVDKTKDRGISNSFRRIEFEGRSIRVNRDDDRNKRTRSSWSKQKDKSKPKNFKPHYKR